jgi:hypothetical protein
MRFGAVAASAGLALAASCHHRAEGEHVRMRPPPGPKTIEVTIKCSAGGVEVAVDDWKKELNPGDDVVWVASNKGDVPDVSIDKENGGPLPFAPGTTFPIKAHKGGSNGVGKGNSNSAKGRYQYTITATCPGQGTTVIIDPDLIIV